MPNTLCLLLAGNTLPCLTYHHNVTLVTVSQGCPWLRWRQGALGIQTRGEEEGTMAQRGSVKGAQLVANPLWARRARHLTQWSWGTHSSVTHIGGGEERQSSCRAKTEG